MTDDTITISALAGLDVDATKSGLSKEDRAKLASKLGEAAHTFAALKPYDVGPRLLESLTDALRKPVAEALGEIWKQRKELREAAASGKDARNVKADVDLIEHSATWTLKPSITVKVTSAPPPVPTITIPLDVTVKFTLRGVRMVIDHAHITKFVSGKLASSVEIKFRDLPLSAPFERELDLAGELVLPGGGIDLS
ncbi:MAG: hypothetical protein ABI664_11660 [bacterium]